MWLLNVLVERGIKKLKREVFQVLGNNFYHQPVMDERIYFILSKLCENLSSKFRYVLSYYFLIDQKGEICFFYNIYLPVNWTFAVLVGAYSYILIYIY